MPDLARGAAPAAIKLVVQVQAAPKAHASKNKNEVPNVLGFAEEVLRNRCRIRIILEIDLQTGEGENLSQRHIMPVEIWGEQQYPVLKIHSPGYREAYPKDTQPLLLRDDQGLLDELADGCQRLVLRLGWAGADLLPPQDVPNKIGDCHRHKIDAQFCRNNSAGGRVDFKKRRRAPRSVGLHARLTNQPTLDQILGQA